jgi:hypothetical protein
MATPLDRLNLTPEERVVFEQELQRLKQQIGAARAAQVFNRLAKGLEAAKGTSIEEVRRRYNFPGRDPAVIQNLYSQLAELGVKAAELDFDRAAKIGDLSKKKVDLMVPMMNALGRAITAEGQFATGVGSARIKALGGLFGEFNSALSRELANLSSDPESDTKRKTIPNEIQGVIELYPGTAVRDLQVLGEQENFLNQVNSALNKVTMPGDTIEMFNGIASQYGGPASFQAILQTSGSAEAKNILSKLESARKKEDEVWKKYGQQAGSLIAKAAEQLGAQRPQFARVIKEVSDAIGGLDGTRGAQAALDQAIEGLLPKKDQLTPIEEERDRLLEALANEQDTRGPVQAAREEFWATPEFQKFSQGITGRSVPQLSFDEKIELTKAAQRYMKASAGEKKASIQEEIKKFEAGQSAGKDLRARTLPTEPLTEASQKPSAQIMQPPAVTDTVPETEDVSDYDSVKARWQGEPVEMRLREKDGKFSIDIVKDGKVAQTIDKTPQTASEFGEAIGTFLRTAEFIEETGEEPSDLFGITQAEAVAKASEQIKARDLEEKRGLFQRQLPEDPFGEFDADDDFVQEAKQIERAAPTTDVPLSVGGPIVSSSIQDIQPEEKRPEWEGQLERDVQAGLLRQQMGDIISGELEQAGVAPEETAKMDAISRTAELFRRKLQQQAVEAGTGR